MEMWALIAWMSISTGVTSVTQTFETRELCVVAGEHWRDKTKNVTANYICVQRRWRDQ